jgi:hypothetical protein
VLDLARGRLRPASSGGPVYLLLVDGECISSVSCDMQPARWDGEVDGYRAVARLPHLTLYEPVAGQQGRRGVLKAMQALVRAYGAQRAFPNAMVAARILFRRGSPERAADLLEQVCRGHPETTQPRCFRMVEGRKLGEGAVMAGTRHRSAVVTTAAGASHPQPHSRRHLWPACTPCDVPPASTPADPPVPPPGTDRGRAAVPPDD